MKYYADLHIHSVLSPCADFLMTPGNLIERLKENEIKIFSITDHNDCGNSRVFQKKAQENGMLFIPGIEIQSAEEVHILGYFKNMEFLEKVAETVKNRLPQIENSEEIYGYQLIVDENDEYIEKESAFLAGACSMGIDEIAALIKENGGIFIPAHIDRSSSIISNIGYFPELPYDGFEIYNKNKIKELKEKYCIEKPVFSSSDSHFREGIENKGMYVEMEELTVESFFNAVKNGKVYIEGVEK